MHTLCRGGKNALYLGDNLKIPRDHGENGSVNLISLGARFNYGATYNLLFKGKSGKPPCDGGLFAKTTTSCSSASPTR